MPPIVSLASLGIREEQRGSHVQAVWNALDILDDLMGDSLYAAGGALSLADCALPPAMFAVRVTGERFDFSALAEHKNLQRYAATIEQHKDVGRVLQEMAEGLKRLEDMAST